MKLTPIFPLWFRTGIVLSVLGAVCFASFTRAYNPAFDSGLTQVDELEMRGELIDQANLHFVDQENGDVIVVDADNNHTLHRLTIGEGGFMRSVVRGLARERRATGHGPEVPFQLAVWQTGLVSLIDPVTQRTVELSAFGPDNVMAFTQLLHRSRDKT